MDRLLWLVVFVAAFASSARSLPVNNGRIYGGEEASDGEIPYQVSIFFGQRFLCGGAIIGNEWIVTAAHCLINEDEERKWKKREGILGVAARGEYFVRAGSLRLDSGGSYHQVDTIIVNPDYGEDDNAVPINDIALFKVSPPISFSNSAKPIPLPPAGLPSPTGQKALVSGWGNTEHGTYSPILLKVVLSICSKTDCDRILVGLPENQICAWSLDSNKDACKGDSGGPLAIDGILHGIVSWGEPTCGVAGVPGAYTEVSYYTNWIKEMTNI